MVPCERGNVMPLRVFGPAQEERAPRNQDTAHRTLAKGHQRTAQGPRRSHRERGHQAAASLVQESEDSGWRFSVKQKPDVPHVFKMSIGRIGHEFDQVSLDGKTSEQTNYQQWAFAGIQRWKFTTRLNNSRWSEAGELRSGFAFSSGRSSYSNGPNATRLGFISMHLGGI